MLESDENVNEETPEGAVDGAAAEPAGESPTSPAVDDAPDQVAEEVVAPEEPAETRMGSGKGSPEGWVAVVKPGRVMFELSGVPEPLAREAMRLAGHKLPVKTKFVLREDTPQ